MKHSLPWCRFFPFFFPPIPFFFLFFPLSFPPAYFFQPFHPCKLGNLPLADFMAWKPRKWVTPEMDFRRWAKVALIGCSEFRLRLLWRGWVGKAALPGPPGDLGGPRWDLASWLCCFKFPFDLRRERQFKGLGFFSEGNPIREKWPAEETGSKQFS